MKWFQMDRLRSGCCFMAVQGRTAYDLAKAGGHRKVMGLLDPVPWLLWEFLGFATRFWINMPNCQTFRRHSETVHEMPDMHLYSGVISSRKRSASCCQSTLMCGRTPGVVATKVFVVLLSGRSCRCNLLQTSNWKRFCCKKCLIWWPPLCLTWAMLQFCIMCRKLQSQVDLGLPETN